MALALPAVSSGASSNPGDAPLPSISVTVLQREGGAGPFTATTINALVGKPIQYEIRVSNTGNAPLTLTLKDAMCGRGTGSRPLLMPGGEAQYTCSHVLKPADASPFIGTFTVIGRPASGPRVSATGSIVAAKQALGPAVTLPCRGKVVRRGGGKRARLCAATKGVRIRRRRRHAPAFTG